MKWACHCAEHVLHLFGERIDERLEDALHVAESWRQGRATVGEARKAALAAIAVARESSNPTAIAVARAVGHAAAGKSVAAERKWQDEQLPCEVKELVLTAEKQKYLRRI